MMNPSAFCDDCAFTDSGRHSTCANDDGNPMAYGLQDLLCRHLWVRYVAVWHPERYAVRATAGNQE